MFYPYGSAPWEDSGDEYEGGDNDAEDGFEFDCYQGPDGVCGKAGSSECDLECPYRDEMFQD
jgi:hypothetical protein